MVRKISLSLAALFFSTQLIAVDLPPSPPADGAPGASTTTNSLTLNSGWNFISSPFDGNMDIATIVNAGCSVNTYQDSFAWFSPATSGTSSVGQAVVANCTSASTVSFSPTLNSTAFSMSSAFSAVGKGSISAGSNAYATGNKYAVIGTPVATTIGAVVTAGSAVGISNVLYYNGSTYIIGNTASDTSALPAGSSFYVQFQQ